MTSIRRLAPVEEGSRVQADAVHHRNAFAFAEREVVHAVGDRRVHDAGAGIQTDEVAGDDAMRIAVRQL